MPYPPVKTENYQNIGGVNRKASPFMTGTNEVIDILNFDYTKPGAYTVRPGSTPVISGFSGTIRGFVEFTHLNGNSYKIFGNGDNLYAWNGTTANIIALMGITFAGTFYGNSGAVLNFTPLVDRLFVAGGIDPAAATGQSYQPFCKTDGATTNFFSLPPPSASLFSGYSILTASGSGWTGFYSYAFGYINDRGYLGPIGFQNNYISALGATILGVVNVPVNGATTVALGFTIGNGAGAIIPSQYGISYLCIFRSIALAGAFVTFVPQMFDLTVLPISGIISGQSNVFVDFGSSYGPLNPTGNTLAPQQLWFTLTPKFIENYNSSLWMCGFSSMPSTVYFSQVGEPELIGSTQSFEVRTNDGDYLTGVRSYLAQLMFFKQRSFHSIVGDDPTNYSLQQISDQYGCVSHRASCVFNNILWFLDKKGIAQYDGANVEIISNRVEPTFRRMNYQAALNQALMLHVKDRNEVWTMFPIDGATFNNYMVVYDYVANAFSEWQGPLNACAGLAFDPNGFLSPFRGGYSGTISYYHASLWTDDGVGFTCSVTPRYFGGQNQEMGYSVEKMFRRAYFDIIDANNTGQTTIIGVNFFSDFVGGSVIASQTFAVTSISHQQTRLDFGIPGKAMTFQMRFNPQTPALNFNGYTIEYRYQRAV